MRLPARLLSLEEDDADEWRSSIPRLVAEICEHWSLTVGDPYEPGGVASLVLPVLGQPLVLKVGYPHLEGEHEAAALRAYDGNGAVRLVDHDAERWAMLLERCEPGTALVDDVVEPLASVNERLWEAPTDGPFRTLEQEITWHGGLIDERRGLGLDDALIDRVLDLHRELLASQPAHVLLHADLHCENVLLSDRGWLAIDPKPLVGDPAYGLSQALAANDKPTPDEVPAISHRLGLDVERVRSWALCRAVELWLDRASRDKKPGLYQRTLEAYS